MGDSVDTEALGGSMQDTAAKLLDRGWNVLPMLPRSKKVALQSWERFQTERVKRDGLLSWLSRNPDANIGIVTGEISGVVVVDIDTPEWKEVMERLQLPATTTVKTSHGVHLYYKHPGVKVKTCRGVIEPGVDIRGDGGYVVGPNSVHPSGVKYELISDAVDIPVLPASIVEKLTDSTPKGDWKEADNGQAEWVTTLLRDGAPKGKRHDSLVRLCCYFFGKHVPSDITRRLLTDWNSRNSPPIDDAALDSTIDDIHDRFKRGEYAPRATDTGEPSGGEALDSDVEAWTSDSGMDAYLSALESGGRDAAIEIPFGYHSLDEHTLGHHKGGVSVVGGYTNVGKTSFVLNCVAANLERGLRVLVLSTEHSVKEVLDRLNALKTSVPLQAFTKGQFAPEQITEVKRHAKTIKGLTVCDAFTPDLRLIERAILKYGPDLLVFDHAQQAATSVDNRYNELSAFARGFKGLMLRHKVAGILVSQLNDLPDGQTEPELKQVSESRVINQVADHVLLLWAADNDIQGDWVNVNIKIAKVKTGGKRGKFPFRFNITNNKFVQSEFGAEI